MPRYSASNILGDHDQLPAVNTASTSLFSNPASAKAALAACACNCSAVLPGVKPRSDSATPTMAAIRSDFMQANSLPLRNGEGECLRIPSVTLPEACARGFFLHPADLTGRSFLRSLE